LDADRAAELFNQWEPALWQGLVILPYSNKGLIYNDPVNIHSPYGFTDLVGKTGELFMESILCWRAFRALEYMSRHFNGIRVEEYVHRYEKIEASIGKLYDEESGMYFAATETCRQIDIWGNAYFLYSGFPCGEHKVKTITKWLTDNISEYVFKGQIRHLPKGQYWQRVLIENEMEKETYQNGAYWAAASGWVIWCLAQDNLPLAAKVFSDCFTDCLQNGFYECVNVNYTKLNNYVVSGTNLLGCALRLKQEGNIGFFAEVNKLLKNMVI
jgi:hypothetical protein